MEKINKAIGFPEVLDIGKYMNINNSIDTKASKSCKYKLYAVAIHEGFELHGGHYYAYIKGTDDCWYLANDETVKKVSLERVLKENAYILLYQKINVSLRKPVEQPAVKSAQETKKEAKMMIEELFKGSKHKKKNLSETAEPMEIESQKIEIEKPKITENKRPYKVEMPRQKPEIVLNKKAKYEDEQEDLITKIKRSYFNADGEIEDWEKEEEKTKKDNGKQPAERMKLMEIESREPPKRMKNLHDLEYDKGKTKKIKDKERQKAQGGLQKQFDLIQKGKEILKI